MEVRQAVKDFNLSLCAILESHVDVGKLSKVCKVVFRSWDWTSNGGCCDKGTRIIIGWDPAIFDVMVLAQSPQVMHLQLVFKVDKRMVFCSIVYAANYYISRRELWHNLSMHKGFVGNKPWCVMGDFNSALNHEDSSMGSSSVSIGMREFQDCVNAMEVFDVNRVGFQFTWNQKPKQGIEFLDIVKKSWETSVNGVHQFRVVKKLRLLKNPLRSLLFKQGNLHHKVTSLRSKLDELQQKIDQNPSNLELRAAESSTSRDLQEASLDEERFLKQKSKVDWLRAGDMNSAFFHSSLKIRNHYNRIDVIHDSEGKLYEGDMVFSAFVKHYEKFFGSQGDISLTPVPELFSKVLSPQVATQMVCPVTAEEVKKAMFSIGIDKAPGPDGYTAGFFKGAWPIIGNDITSAVMDFFETGLKARSMISSALINRRLCREGESLIIFF
ncbi:uncharacterized protein LOC110865358 [Helianthus annuus]|uniref:uncharacterized protein LOC110865358 n=1 Tax=Helianthus annuus TaxID=4232 RepID=UPI000B8FE33F|nr:uncharacterized protein LOC110865358 [Helianthus annuus]